MKRTFTALMASLIALFLLAGCAGQPAGTNAGDTEAVTAAADSAKLESTASELTPAPAPEPKSFAPADIFGSEFNPFYDVKFPQNFKLYGAFFDIGDPKFDGTPKYMLSITAESKTDESITFLSKLAGIEDENSVSKFIEEFNKNGFCEFKSAAGGVYTIRRTDRNDDRYQYVEGCHIDLRVDLDSGETSKYITLVSENYAVKALSVAENYFDVTPVFDECGIYVNLHKKSAEINVLYDVKDVGAVEQKMAEETKSNWYDSKQGKMGLSYGVIDLSFSFDKNAGQIYVNEKLSDLQSVWSDYTAPDVSLTTLGFSYFEKDALCIYEDKKEGIEVAIHRPEWGNRDDNMNIQYLQEVNGYLLVVWYYADEQKYTVQADKGSSSAKYDYFIKTGEFGNEWPADTVKEHFCAVFETRDDDVYEEAVSLFKQTLQERFGMGLENLYALPIR